MVAYKEPGFQERVALAGQAKAKALALLRSKPPIDAAEQAARAARVEARGEAAAQKRAAASAAKEMAQREAAAVRAQAAEAASVAAAAPVKEPGPSEADRKAARDARYAARKKRK